MWPVSQRTGSDISLDDKLRSDECTTCAETRHDTQRTGSDILARNICVAAWLSNLVFPVEALTHNPEILI